MIKEKPTRQPLNKNDSCKAGNISKYMGEVVHFKASVGRAMTTNGWVSGRLDDIGKKSVYLGGGGTFVGSIPLNEISEVKAETLKTHIMVFEK